MPTKPVMFSLDYNPFSLCKHLAEGKIVRCARHFNCTTAFHPFILVRRSTVEFFSQLSFARNRGCYSPAKFGCPSSFPHSRNLAGMLECAHCHCPLSKIVPRIYGHRGAAATNLIPTFIGFFCHQSAETENMWMHLNLQQCLALFLVGPLEGN